MFRYVVVVVCLFQISEHAITLDREALVHITQGPQQRHSVYVYQLDRESPPNEVKSVDDVRPKPRSRQTRRRTTTNW